MDHFWIRGGKRFSVCFASDAHRGRVFWFRLFSWGLHLSRSEGYVKLFSELYGDARAIYLGPLRIGLLRPY